MSRSDWLNACWDHRALEASSQCDSIWISLRLCRAHVEPGHFSDEGFDLSLYSSLRPTQNKLIICDKMFADLTKLDRNYCTDLDGIKEKVTQCLIWLAAYHWAQTAKHHKFGELFKMSMQQFQFTVIKCSNWPGVPHCGQEVQWVVSRGRIIMWLYESSVVSDTLPAAITAGCYNNIYFVLRYNIAIIDNIDSGLHHYY